MSSSTTRIRRKNAAIVGLGWWGRQHILRQMIGSDIVRIVYAVGSREEHRAHAQKFDVTFTTDFARILGDGSIDFVILATPHAQHARQIEAVAGAGKHVFCEKPVGRSVDEVSKSLEACRVADVRFGVGHERRFEPAVEELRRLLVDGSLGTIMHVEASFNHDKLRGIAGDNWRVSAQGEIPLAMTATGIHLTDLLLDLVGPIETVTAFPATRISNTGYADTLSVHFGFASEATGYLNTVLATPLLPPGDFRQRRMGGSPRLVPSGRSRCEHADSTIADGVAIGREAVQQGFRARQSRTVRTFDRRRSVLSVHGRAGLGEHCGHERRIAIYCSRAERVDSRGPVTAAELRARTHKIWACPLR
jgi:predicted dehydrogenase